MTAAPIARLISRLSESVAYMVFAVTITTTFFLGCELSFAYLFVLRRRSSADDPVRKRTWTALLTATFLGAAQRITIERHREGRISLVDAIAIMTWHRQHLVELRETLPTRQALSVVFHAAGQLASVVYRGELQSVARSSVTRIERTRSQLHCAPGWRLHRMASFVFSKRTFQEVIEPALSDLQVDYFDALHDGLPRKARWVQLRGYCCFWSHVVLQLPVSALARIWKWIA